MEQKVPNARLTTLFPLLAACLAVASAASYQNFQREHIDYPTTQVPDPQQYCNLMMQRRDMATPKHCKHLNTFIHADPSHIQDVCGQGGQPTTGDLRESNAPFSLTMCKLRRGSWATSCQYERTSGSERIIIACANGYPVHLQTEVPE
ncbi:probable inactive ribonuclease-like protein 12 [Hemicordylus capensis]|uniref:probable inactive ribonuclease-like protein 12 n=1 Tax=Hemicordylus capensis TaxID=884348 RepID=UPI0023031295|nr:probable inactive ribonuclease-like protein 12 [Hemicordylus capensis]